MMSKRVFYPTRAVTGVAAAFVVSSCAPIIGPVAPWLDRAAASGPTSPAPAISQRSQVDGDDGAIGAAATASRKSRVGVLGAGIDEERVLPQLKCSAGVVAAGTPQPILLEPNKWPSKPAEVFEYVLAKTGWSVVSSPGEIDGIGYESMVGLSQDAALRRIRAKYGLEYEFAGCVIYVKKAAMQTRIFVVDFPQLTRSSQAASQPQSDTASIATKAVWDEMKLMLEFLIKENEPVKKSGGTVQTSQTSTAPEVVGTKPSKPASAGANLEAKSKPNPKGRAKVTATAASQPTSSPTPVPSLETSVEKQDQIDSAGFVMSPRTNSILVRAMPQNLRAIESYLKATQVGLVRQVMIEAKIVEVTLSKGERMGINWAAFKVSGGSRASAGVIRGSERGFESSVGISPTGANATALF
jgi:hypothetical protein